MQRVIKSLLRFESCATTKEKQTKQKTRSDRVFIPRHVLGKICARKYSVLGQVKIVTIPQVHPAYVRLACSRIMEVNISLMDCKVSLLFTYTPQNECLDIPAVL